MLLFFHCFFSAIWADSHHPQQFLKSIKGRPDEGKQIYRHFCGTCHAPKPIINLGAPKKGDPQQWQSRLQQGMAVLFQHTNEGFNAMPARGGCFECTDEQLILALTELLPKAQKKTGVNFLKDYKKYKK